MQKRRTHYTSPLDALIAVLRRLNQYEYQYHWRSEKFFERYRQGQLADELDFVEWANDYRHYPELHRQLTRQLQGVVF
ncbi:MAG: antitoxin TumA [Cyanobacteria bacterium P01_G01_bin.54]